MSLTKKQGFSKCAGFGEANGQRCDVRINQCALRTQLLDEERLDKFFVLVTIRIMPMTRIRIELLLRRTNGVENRIARLRRADIIVQPDVDEDRALDLIGKVDAVIVRPGLFDYALQRIDPKRQRGQ